MIKGKTPRIDKELAELPVQNARLAKLLKVVEAYSELEFGKDVIVTCLYRSPAENLQVGGIPNSPHLVWEGVDIRSFTYSPQEIERLVNFLNQFSYTAPKKVAMYHKVGDGAAHFHIQYRK